MTVQEAGTNPNLELGESLTDNGLTYFVFRLSGLTASDVLQANILTSQQVLAWPDDINKLGTDINRIDAELEHAILNLSDEVVQVFENEVSVTEESVPTVTARMITTNHSQLRTCKLSSIQL